MIKSIQIDGLFNHFNYFIDFQRDEITILTGPNGYGKTTILKAIQNLGNRNYLFFFKLDFQLIEVSLTDQDAIRVTRNGEESITVNNETIDRKAFIKAYFENYKSTRFHRMDNERWYDRQNEKFYTVEELLSIVSTVEEYRVVEKSEYDFPVYLIKEQRLIKQNIPTQRRNNRVVFEDPNPNSEFSYAIDEYAKELREIIAQTLRSLSLLSQDLDGSFPRRLFDQEKKIDEHEFNERFLKVKEIQNRLNQYNITVFKNDNHPIYKEENSKALLVYLGDTEKKLEVFSSLISKLDIFTDILNSRRLTFKHLEIDREAGFYAMGDKGERIPLTDLSSGEQHEIVLFYELLFRVEERSLVMIDEPELSLHVAWQKDFLTDISRIAEIKNIKIVLSTHSPQIIADRWENVYDLMENGDAV